MKSRVTALGLAAFAGALFGAGLLISGMTRPSMVLGFLDVTRDWNPSLAFVMAGAVPIYAIAFAWLHRQTRLPWFGDVFHLPTRKDVDAPLIVGAAIFGVGWGLVGICPGPAVVSAATGGTSPIVFALAMLAGMALHRRASRATDA